MTKSLSSRHVGNSVGVLRISLSLVASAFIATYSLAADDSGELPKRYSQLGLEEVEEISDFQYRRSRRGDKQSMIVRSNSMDSYLLVFNQTLPFRASITGYVDEDLQAGVSRICIANEPNYYKGSFECPHQVLAIYPLKDMEQENQVVKFLRAND